MDKWFEENIEDIIKKFNKYVIRNDANRCPDCSVELQ